MTRLTIRVLGPFQVLLDGKPATGFISDKARALLAYLAVEGDRPHRRDSLAGLLWSDFRQDLARSSLRTALANLRQVIGDRDSKAPFLHVTRQTVQVCADHDAVVDVSDLIGILEPALLHAADDETEYLLEDAVALYRGEFLAGFSLSDSTLFEDWALLQREQIRRQVLVALHRLSTICERDGDLMRALRHAWQAVDLDPLGERAQRQLMRLLALSGQREVALTQYDTFRNLLADQLGVEPSPETRDLLRILADEIVPAGEAELAALRERELVLAGPCPYRGLAAFREQDARFFFGREELVERMAAAVGRQPLVAIIVGSSGCGKSSAVFAGLLPRLRSSGDWLVASFRPGSEPFAALAAALSQELELEAGGLDESLAMGKTTLRQIIGPTLETKPAAQRLLLVIDQFEELYALCSDPRIQRRFLDVLLKTIQGGLDDGSSSVVVLLTLRADFMGQAVAYRPLADRLQDASVIIGPMTRNELRAAIERPAQRQGAIFETGLVERILDDVGEEPGNLPLLEFALTLLWERQRYGWLTHAGYEAIGRVAGALALYADQVLGKLDQTEQIRARQVFTQLVRPGEGTEDSRRVATRIDLGEANWRLVQRLADSRLVVTGLDSHSNETAEIVHEALIQAWGQLVEWMAVDRAFRIWQERLRSALRAWEATGHDNGALLRGAPLAEAESWRDERAAEISLEERDYIQAGIILHDQRAAKREEQRQRELEAAQKLAKTEQARAEDQSRAAHRLRRRALWLAVALSLAALLAATALLLGRTANQERAEAESQARVATARELAASAVSNLNVDVERAILLALESVKVTWSTDETALPEALSALHQTVNASRLRFTLPHGGGVAYSPDGRQIATCGPDATVRLWDSETREETLVFSGHIDEVLDVSFSPDGRQLASASIDGTVRLWDLASGKAVLTLDGQDHSLFRLEFSPDGSQLAATSFTDGVALVWDSKTGELLHVLAGHYSDLYGVDFSPDGKHLVTGGWDFTAKFWDAGTGEEIFDLFTGEEWVTAVAFSPDGNHVATALQITGVTIWDVAASLAAAAGKEVLTINLQGGFLVSMAYSPDGQLIATGDSEGTLQVWDANSGRELISQAAHDHSIQNLAFSPDGKNVATSSADGSTKVWDLTLEGSSEWRTLSNYSIPNLAFSPDGEYLAATDYVSGETRVLRFSSGEVLLSLPHPPPVMQVAFSPDGKRIATNGLDGTVVSWELDKSTQKLSSHELYRIQYSELPLWGLDFSPDGAQLVTGGDEGIAYIFDALDGRILHILQGHTNWINAVAFSLDGHMVATGSGDGTARIWDASTGDKLMTLTGHTRSGLTVEPALNDVTFSPDSRLLATAGWDGTARIWDTASGESIHTLAGHSGWLMHLRFSPNGETLATTSDDGTAIVWDVETGSQLFTLTGHTAAAYGVAYSPDGRILVTSGWDGTLRFYYLSTAELMEEARSKVTRSLTVEECQRFLHRNACPSEP